MGARRLLVINVDDPLAASLHNVADVEEQCPGVVSGVREWFRWYKTPDDKPINAFGPPPSSFPFLLVRPGCCALLWQRLGGGFAVFVYRWRWRGCLCSPVPGAGAALAPRARAPASASAASAPAPLTH